MNFDRFNSLRAIAGIALILFWGIPCLATGLGYMYVIALISIIIGILLIVIPSKDEDANANDKKPSKPYDPNSYSNLRIHYSKVKSDNSIQELKDVLKEKTKMLLRAYMLDSQITDDELDRILEESYDEQMVNNKLSDHIPYCKPTVSEFSHNILSMTSKLLSEMEIPMLKALSIEYYAKEAVAYTTDETISEVISSFNQHAPRTLYFFREKVNYELAALGLIMQYAIDQNDDAVADAVTDIRISRGYLPPNNKKANEIIDNPINEADKKAPSESDKGDDQETSAIGEIFKNAFTITLSRHKDDHKSVIEVLIHFIFKSDAFLLAILKEKIEELEPEHMALVYSSTMIIALMKFNSFYEVMSNQEFKQVLDNRFSVYLKIMSKYDSSLGWESISRALIWFIRHDHEIFEFTNEEDENGAGEFLNFLSDTQFAPLVKEELKDDYIEGTLEEIWESTAIYYANNNEKLVSEIKKGLSELN